MLDLTKHGYTEENPKYTVAEEMVGADLIYSKVIRHPQEYLTITVWHMPEKTVDLVGLHHKIPGQILYRFHTGNYPGEKFIGELNYGLDTEQMLIGLEEMAEIYYNTFSRYSDEKTEFLRKLHRLMSVLSIEELENRLLMPGVL